MSDGDMHFEEDVNEVLEDLKPEDKEVITTEETPWIKTISDAIDDGSIDPQPPFQRGFIWWKKKKKMSKLIESVLMDIPIPIIYTAETKDNRQLVIDGQQRVLTFKSFLENKFRLRGLEVLTEFEGLLFKDLPPEKRRKIRTYPLRIIKIKKTVNENVKFNVFERLNTGATPLRNQEIRNCIYHGKYNDFLKETAKNPNFLKLLGLKKPDDRMKDVEYVLLFCAFYHMGFHNYKGQINSFLNKEMEMNKNISEKEMEEVEDAFNKAIDLCLSIFGENAFRRFESGSEEDRNSYYTNRINQAIYQILVFSFGKLFEKRDFVGKINTVKEKFLELQMNDDRFYDSVYAATNKKDKTQYRFETWINALRKIVGYPKNEKRIYDSQLKKDLFNTNNTCKICGEEIKVIDDAHIDHEIAFALKGETLPKNAQLAHRYCNYLKGKKPIIQPS